MHLNNKIIKNYSICLNLYVTIMVSLIVGLLISFMIDLSMWSYTLGLLIGLALYPVTGLWQYHNLKNTFGGPDNTSEEEK